VEFKEWFWTKPRRRVRALVQRRDLENELDEELQHYVSLRTEQLMEEGLRPAEARRAAVRALGGIEQVKEECRDARGVRFVEELWQDTGYAIRTLRKTPAFAFGAIGLLSLAIAANLMVASLVRTLFFDPLPYPASQQLVAVWQEFTTSRPEGMGTAFSIPEVIELQHQIQSFEQVAAFHYTVFSATGADSTERVRGATVSPNLFTVLGVLPVSGGVFDPDNVRGPGSDGIVMSERLWRRLYASDPALVGKQIQLDDRMRTVLGIMPADFEFPLPRFDGRGAHQGLADIWQPIAPTKPTMDARGMRNYNLVGRLKADTSLQALNRELELLSSLWRERYGSIYQLGGMRLDAAPLQRGIGARMKSATLVLAAAVLLVWSISAANLIAMLLARAATARRQMAIRMALGCGPLRLLRQAMSEGVLLAMFGSAFGILLGGLGIRLLRAEASQSSPLFGHMHVDPSVILMTITLSLVTALLFGLVPGAYAVRHATLDTPKAGGGSAARLRPHPLRDRLVIGETALALVLLVGAGLLTKSFLRLQDVYPGFKAAGVVTMDISLPEARYPEAGAVSDFFSRVARDVALQPGVNSAAFISLPPFGGATTDSSFTIEDGPNTGRLSPPDEEIRIITPDYFRVLEISLLHGRVFASLDKSDSQPVVVVNQALALRYWGTEDVVGKRIKLDYPRDTGWRAIVGVVGNIKQSALDAPEQPELYIPHTQMMSHRMVMTVKTDRTPQDAIAMMRDTVQSIDSRQPVANARMLGRTIADSILPRTFAAALVGGFAIVGLLLAVAGIYAVISYSTVERGHEIAVRMAIGANRGDIIVMVLKQSGRLLLAGALIGFVITVGASVLLRPMLYEVSAFDPAILLSMLGFLTTCGLVAAYIPARRATRHNIALALAHE
jgi:predicted permease